MSDEELSNGHLPVEVLSHIFRFLPYSDIKEARLVNNQWYVASLDPSLLDRETAVTFSEHNSVFQDILLKSFRDFLHLSVRDSLLRLCDTKFFKHENIWENQKFWAKIGPKLRSLALHNCKLSQLQLLPVLQHCSHLRVLEIVACPNLFKSDDTLPLGEECWETSFELPNLHSLRIGALYNPRYTHTYMFDLLVSNAPNLKVLSLDECLVPERLAHDEGLTSQHIQAFVDKNSHRNFDLNLRCQEGDDFKAFTELASRPNVRLRALQVHYHYKVVKFFSDRVMDLITSQQYLEELELSCEVGDLLLAAICCSLLNLKDLKLLYCCAVVRGVGFIFSLKKLTSLQIMECYQVESAAVVCGLCGSVDTTMESLTLTGGERLGSAVVIELARTHPALTYLDLSYCNCVTSSSVQAIYRYLVALRSLVLANCKNLDDAGLTGAHSDLSCRLYPLEYSISCLKDLRMLNLSHCSLTGSSFKVGLNIPNIRHVILDNNEITSEAFECFAKNNRTIENLQVAHCENVTDNVLNVVGENLRRLKRINLESCPAVTRRGVHLLRRKINGLKVESTLDVEFEV